MNESINAFVIFRILLFWILFLVPGAAVYSRFFKDTTKDYLSLKLVYSFFISLSMLLPITAVAYFKVINVSVLSYGFCLVALLSVGYLLAGLRPYSLARIKTRVMHVFGRRFNPGSLLLASVLIINYGIQTWAKTFLIFGGDAWVHIAKINHTLAQGFSTYDPFFLVNGQNITLTTHPSNIVHASLALTARITGVSALDVWAYSGAFFSSVALLTLYVFTKELTAKRSIALIAVSLFYVSQFNRVFMWVILYPATQAVFVSLFLFIVLLRLLRSSSEGRAKYVLYIITLLLLVFTHQIQYTLVALFLVGFYIFLYIKKSLTMAQVLKLSLPFALGVPVLFFALHKTKYIADSVLNIGTDQLWHYRHIIYAPKPTTGILSLGSTLSVIGLVLIARNLRNRTSRMLLYYAFIFGSMLLYTPFIMLVMYFLPFWAVQRYGSTNYVFVIILIAVALNRVTQLSTIMNDRSKYLGVIISIATASFYILPMSVLGVSIYVYAVTCTFVALSVLSIWYLRQPDQHKKQYMAPVSILTIILLLSFPLTVQRINLQDLSLYAKRNNSDYTTAKKLAKFTQHIRPGATLLAPNDISLAEPGLCYCYVAGIEFSHTTNSIDANQRSRDNNNFFSKNAINPAQRGQILQKYKPDYVIIVRNQDGDTLLSDFGYRNIEQSSIYTLYGNHK